MRRKIFFMITMLILASLTVSGCGGKETKNASTKKPVPTEQKIELKLADSFPKGHIYSVEGGQFWMKRVEELTNGQVTFKHYPAEQLGKAKDMLELVRGGTTDVAYVGPAYVAGKLPLSGVGELPGLFDGTLAGTKAFWKIAQGILYEKEYKKYGIKPVFVLLLPPYNVVNSKKPIEKIEDLKGIKIRVAGGAMEDTVKIVGAVPVALPAPELYEAFQRGVIDGTVGPYVSWPPYKVEELAKYGTVGANFGSFVVAYFINETVWQNMTDDFKKAIKQAGDETVEHLAKAVMAEEEKVTKEWMKDKKLYQLTPQDKVVWSEKLKPVCDKWAEIMEQKGFPGKKVLSEFIKAVQEVKTGN